MADKLVTVAQFNNYIEAEMAKQQLADYGIKAVVSGQHASTLYGTALGRPELLVLESQAEKAKQVLQSQKSADMETNNPTEE